MRVPDEVRHCVVFIGVNVPTDVGMVAQLIGTAFFVSINSDQGLPVQYIYLVTAKHVVEAVQGREFFMRANLKEGGSTIVQGRAADRWWYHPTDHSADVAVRPWAPGPEIECRYVPGTMLLTEEIIRSQSIGTGDEVFMTGLFAHVSGMARNIPIVRMGNIAMMPDEPIPTDQGAMEAYLIEARSIGGLSGSPAFVRETLSMGTGSFYLMGLMHGHWDIPPESINDRLITDHGDLHGAVNMGIAIVVPAKKIRDVLNCPELFEHRHRQDEAWRKEHQPTLDEQLGDMPTTAA